ncbi:MAG: glycosyltransferase [Candidatus Pacebacteria bacterium]|nr:glycosyltransferase [Candidatus Paceibacterota bacterium]MDD5357044.1 glycosyltransferase [Candidatus Paceibacterota bacterium]
MKVAILHDDFTVCGGAEKLVALLSSGLNKKGIETEIITFDFRDQLKKIIPKNLVIKTLNHEKLPNLPIMRQAAFAELNVRDEYDFFIFSGHLSLYAAKIHTPNLFYCHYVSSIGFKEPKIIDGIQNPIFRHETMSKNFDALVKALFEKGGDRYLKYIVEQRETFSLHGPELSYGENLKYIQTIATNSAHTSQKLKKACKRRSLVIYPPVETSNYGYKKQKGYWISVNRIVPMKRIRLQLVAFSQLPDEKLYIIGQIENDFYYQALKKIKPPNVHFLGVIGGRDLIQRLSECRGFIFTAKDEDFGMSVIEAMASGKAVIAPFEGGLKESVQDGKVGKLIRNINAKKLAKAIQNIGKELEKNPEKYRKACTERARKFDVSIFIEKIKTQIEKHVS